MADDELLHAVLEPRRRVILRVLRDEGGLAVGRLATRFDVSRPAISQHLAKLRLAGLVTQRRAGRHVLSRARDHHVGELLDVLVHDAGHRRTMTAHPREAAP